VTRFAAVLDALTLSAVICTGCRLGPSSSGTGDDREVICVGFHLDLEKLTGSMLHSRR
jgi:hypothetical protein